MKMRHVLYKPLLCLIYMAESRIPLIFFSATADDRIMRTIQEKFGLTLENTVAVLANPVNLQSRLFVRAANQDMFTDLGSIIE